MTEEQKEIFINKYYDRWTTELNKLPLQKLLRNSYRDHIRSRVSKHHKKWSADIISLDTSIENIKSLTMDTNFEHYTYNLLSEEDYDTPKKQRKLLTEVKSLIKESVEDIIFSIIDTDDKLEKWFESKNTEYIKLYKEGLILAKNICPSFLEPEDEDESECIDMAYLLYHQEKPKDWRTLVPLMSQHFINQWIEQLNN